MSKGVDVKQIVFIISLFVAGALSPSNGVDDIHPGKPTEMLLKAMAIMAVGIVLHLIVTKKLSIKKQKN